MKYQENVCQYKIFSSISIVSGSNISQTSSLPLSPSEGAAAVSSVKASEKFSNPVCNLRFQTQSQISKLSKLALLKIPFSRVQGNLRVEI